MYPIITLALKDLRLLTRDWFGLFWIVAFPVLYALFFGSIMGGGGERTHALPVAVIDEDQSDGSRAFAERLREKKDVLRVQTLPRDEAQDRVRKGDLVAFVVLKPGFGEAGGLFNPRAGSALEVGIDPRRKAEAGYLQGVLMEVRFTGMMADYTDPAKSRQQLDAARKEIDAAPGMAPRDRQALKVLFGALDQFFTRIDPKALRQGAQLQPAEQIQQVEVTRAVNQPFSAFEITFPSSVIWAIMGCVTSFAISLVTERVSGTLLRLRLAPLRWSQLLAGKGLACFLACTGVATFLLLFGHFLLGVRLVNPVGLALAILCTGCCFVGLMMLFATLGKTQHGVAGAGWGILMPLAMLGGGMVPLIAMPDWMQTASNVSPIKWGILALEGAIWRGFSLREMLLPCAILVGVGVVCFALGVRNLSRAEG